MDFSTSRGKGMGTLVGSGSSSKRSRVRATITFSSFIANCFPMQFLGHKWTIKLIILSPVLRVDLGNSPEHTQGLLSQVQSNGCDYRSYLLSPQVLALLTFGHRLNIIQGHFDPSSFRGMKSVRPVLRTSKDF